MTHLQFEINIHVGYEDDPELAQRQGALTMERLRRLTGADIRKGFRVCKAQIQAPEGLREWNILSARASHIGSFVALANGIHQLAVELEQEVIPIYVPSHKKGVLIGPGNYLWPLFDPAKFVHTGGDTRPL